MMSPFRRAHPIVSFRKLAATLLLGLCALTGLAVEPGRAQVASDKDAIHAALNGYYDAFGRDAAAAGSFYGEPTLFIAPNQFTLLNSRADIEAFFERAAAGLKRGGFSNSTLIDRRIRMLSATTALLGGVAIRIKADGTEMNRAGFTYLLQKSGSGWKIHEIIATDPDKLISAD